MFRRDSILELGGYSTAGELYGWEEYDLWLSIAEHGQRGELVTSIVGRSAFGAARLMRSSVMPGALTQSCALSAEYDGRTSAMLGSSRCERNTPF